ncbi:Conidial yellow pigment biosynthesis polyketide synthase [Termitomyces sp. J132]|nr:Conidial yellow pigment biosynthesis polyketide synthase [Termitomyces sp. J132]
MITRDSLDLYLPIFAGQGTSAATAPKTRETALSDASSSSGTLLLTACFEAFHHELSYLPAGDFSVLDIDRADFSLPKDLLSTPEQRYEHNAVVSGSTIFLIQILRYLVFAETTRIPINSVTPFSDILKGNIEHELGIIGFSSGILPACVVATSFSTLSYVTNAVEAYRLAIWVGIRSHLYRVQTLNAASLDSNTDLPWSLVLIGITKVDAENALATYNKGNDEAKLYLTAIMNDTCVTISGRPDILSDFSTFLATNVKVIIHKTSLGTLYHSPIHANSTRDQVLRDVVARRIRFPEFSDIQVPIRSTFTGDAITKNETSGSLLELVVDLLLVHPVNWNIMVDHLIKSLPQDTHIRLLNVGPGLGLTRTSIQSHPQPPPKQEPIAIIGMAVNMPGAPNVSKLWEVLEHGINTVSEIPGCRFRISDYQESKNSQRYMKARTGNFIEGADEFDNKFFKISPREAKNMDPQQRILLHTAYEALEDSGYVPNSTPTNRPESFGCYIGVSTHDYLQNLRDNIDVYYSPGTLKAFLSGRISYAMQLSGPSIVVDTACSSSNVALYHGARALMNRDCNAALVGGINIITSPDMFLGLDRGHFLSPTGQCKSFDAAADGYSRGEGCGVFVLKRLSDAVADNDRILGVIRGIEVNQSGRAHSITHPHAPTQAALFRRVLKNSNIDPNRVNVIEAHGTGTQAGDPHELESIRSVFSAQRTVNNPLHITSIKANIGHLEAASGSAGLAKLLLMFQHQTIPRQISLYTLNPRITPLENDHTIIDSVSVPWHPAPNGSTRIAMLNNFGAAGSNSALLVEEHQKPVVTSNFGETHFLFGFSAKTDSALESLRSRYLDFLENPGASSLADIAYTMTARRLIYDHRLAVSADSKEDLIIKLRRALPSQATPKDARTVFVFSGQGGQYLGMGRSLYQKSQLFKFHVDECHAILRKEGSPGVLPILTADSPTSGLADLEEFEAYQASIFTLQYAMARLWISWGVSPAAVVGHSLGEYAALVIAGVMSVEDALHIVAHRVRLMVQRCAANETGMIAINLGPIALHDVLSASTEFSELSIACYNSPIDCVLSGPLMKLKALKAHLDAEIRCKNVLLAVPFGYHSQAMSPLLEDLNIIAQRVTLNPPNIPIVSNVLGELVHPGDHSIFVADYFARHCAEPVQFDKGIRSLVASCSSTPIDLWIEIGPHTTTLPMIKANHSLRRGNILIGSLRKQRDGWETLTGSLAQLYSSGINVRWRDTFAHLQGVKCISLPSYPFSPSKFWVEYKEHLQTSAAQASSTSSSSTGYSMLGSWVQWPSSENENTAIFETPIEKVARWINGHSVGGMPLCPASVYIEQALSAIHLTCAHLDQALQGSHAALRKLVFAKPLVHDSSIERILITTVQIQTGSGTFRISSRMSSAKDEDTHAYGECRLQPTTSTLTKFIRTLPTVSRYIAAVSRASSGIHPEVFSARTAYEVIFPRVVVYSKEYRSIRSLTVDASNMEGCADVRLPEDYNGGKFVVHPVFSDTLLHVAGFVANLQGGADDAFICSEVDSIKILPDLVDNDASYTIYCSNSWVPEDEMVLSDAYAVLSGESKKIVAHIKGIQFRRVRLDRLKRALSLTSKQNTVHPTGSDSPITVLSGASTPRTLFPEDAPSDSTQNEELDVKDILASVLGLATYDIDDDVDFDSLGLDSLTSIEMFHAIENEFDLELPSNLLTTYRTSRTLQTYLTSRLSKIAKVRHPEIVHEKLNLTIPTNTDTKFKTLRLEVNPISVQSSNSNRLPLFFIHDGSGLVNYYERLPPLDRPIWAIHNPNFSTSQPWNSISEMARTYAKLIANLIIGPIIVGGWSFGGVAAYEVARQLELLGRTTQGILLIDAPNPVGHVPLSDSIINTVLHLQRRSIISSEIGRLVKAQFSMNSRLLGNYKPEPFMHDSPHLIMLRSKEGFKPPHVQVPAWLSDRTRPEAAISGWQTLSRGHVDILDIPGHHFEPFHRNNASDLLFNCITSCISDDVNRLKLHPCEFRKHVLVWSSYRSLSKAIRALEQVTYYL